MDQDNVATADLNPLTPKGAREIGGRDLVAPLELIDALLGALYEGPLENPPWQSVLQLLRDTLRAEHVTLMLRPPSHDSSGIMINTGPVVAEKVVSYETHFFALDPFVRLKEGEVVTAEELIGKQWLESPIYLEYLKPLNIRHLLANRRLADRQRLFSVRRRALRPHWRRYGTADDGDQQCPTHHGKLSPRRTQSTRRNTGPKVNHQAHQAHQENRDMTGFS